MDSVLFLIVVLCVMAPQRVPEITGSFVLCIMYEGFGLTEHGVNTLICRRGTLGVNVDENSPDDDDTPDPEHIQRLKELWPQSWQDVGIGGCYLYCSKWCIAFCFFFVSFNLRGDVVGVHSNQVVQDTY